MSATRASRANEDLKDRIGELHSHDLDHSQRMIYLMGVEEHPDDDFSDPGVEFRQTNRFIRNINILTSLDPEKPVLICMKNPGGYVEEGFSIFDAIQAAPMPVTILGYSCVASMASIIFQAANKRVIMPSATFMFHMGVIDVSGTPKQVDSSIKMADKFHEDMLDIYVNVMKTSPNGKCKHWSKKRIREWLMEQIDKKEDVYLTADQAVEWGFADEVFNGWPTLFKYTDEELLRK